VSSAPSQPLTWSLELTTAVIDGAHTLCLAGRLGTTGAVELSRAVAASGVALAGLRLDLARVDYLSSAGLAALRDLSRRAADAGGALHLVGASEPVRLALRLGGASAGLDVSRLDA